jgi:hypothetical protein
MYTVRNAKHRHSSLLMPVKKKPAAKWATAVVVTSNTPLTGKQLSLWARIKAVFTGDYS